MCCGRDSNTSKTTVSGEYVATMPDGSKVTVKSRQEERQLRDESFRKVRAAATAKGYTVG